jgi:hypothetical protein
MIMVASCVFLRFAVTDAECKMQAPEKWTVFHTLAVITGLVCALFILAIGAVWSVFPCVRGNVHFSASHKPMILFATFRVSFISVI